MINHQYSICLFQSKDFPTHQKSPQKKGRACFHCQKKTVYQAALGRFFFENCPGLKITTARLPNIKAAPIFGGENALFHRWKLSFFGV